ncbi:MAG: hypothetical protein ACYCZN_01730 [Candidatus Dormibacteria bacterium]
MKFDAGQFTATKFDSAEDKAKGLSALVSFIQSGFPESKFTRRVYDALYLHMLGHIAHFNRAGFYAEWFASPESELQWLRYAAHGGAYGVGIGDPAFTWSDVETVLVEWVRASGLVAQYEGIVEGRTRSRELAQLAYLQAKYSGRASGRAA